MPLMPLPREWDTFLSRANPAVIATIRKDGSPHSVATRSFPVVSKGRLGKSNIVILP